MQLQTFNWLNEVVPQMTSAGTVNERYFDRRPAASTALHSILERKLAILRKTRIDFFLTHVDLLLMMRCKHGELKLSRFLAREPGVKKPLAKFEDTRTGLVLFLTAMQRAQSLEIGVTEAHLAGWRYLLKLGAELAERGFARARPQDFFDFVHETFVTFSSEHRDAITNTRDISDYPTFDNLEDADETVQPAFEMLTGGNVMRSQVDKIVTAQLALLGTPLKGKKRPSHPSPTTSDSSTSPSPTKGLSKSQKKNARKKRSAASEAQSKKDKAAAAAAKVTAAAAAAAAAAGSQPPSGPTAQQIKDRAASKAKRFAEIAAWMLLPESKDKNGAVRCYLFNEDPSHCKAGAACPRSHEPGVT
jgi:hypothetical protein